jgi:hypothetical protein
MSRSDQSRTTFAAPPTSGPGGAVRVRPFAAPRWSAVGRVILAPFALVLAALGGVLFAILLPICGIATIAEAVAKGSWAFVRRAASHPAGSRIHQN